MITILQGDVIEQLRTLPDESVHCCVTSPPYWGLRDYGTAQWEGGDTNCDHKKVARVMHAGRQGNAYGTPPGAGRIGDEFYIGVCDRCGAKAGDSQIGREKTPEEYLAKMVQVFREVRRVLRKDGTLWLNLGSSYASGDMQPNQSRSDAPACDNDGKALQDSQNVDRVCPDSCDESQGETRNRRDCNAHNDQSFSLNERRLSQIGRGSERPDSVSTSPAASARGVRASNTRASWRRDRAACVPAAKASESREAAHSSSRNVQASGRNSWVNHAIFSQQFKPKDMVPIPWMVAMALQADGWWLRSDIIWAKPNPMPESVTDRPTKAHEYLFLLTKSANYFYDAEAIREKHTDPLVIEGKFTGKGGIGPEYNNQGWNGKTNTHKHTDYNPAGRNKRSVWTVATAPYPEAHFATYPPDLIKPCILAGTSAKGCCAKCGSPWERIVERISSVAPTDTASRIETYLTRKNVAAIRNRPDDGANAGFVGGDIGSSFKTIGWEPTCKCHGDDWVDIWVKNHPLVPCTVLDPFFGSGTTGAVALELGRKCIGIELNPAYVRLAEQRCNVTPGLQLA